MDAIVLAGGFAKRLWPLTKELPKPLLPVAGKPIIEYILENLDGIEDLDKIYISINQKFEPHFKEWSKGVKLGKELEIVVEPATCENDKMGAVGALGFLIRQKEICSDLLVVAGDNLFDFDIKKFITGKDNGFPVVALYDMEKKERIKKKYGVVVLDEKNMIKELHEKPEKPVSTIISTGCYFFPKKAVEMIHEYLSVGNNPDAPGFFISWLTKRLAVQGFVFDGESKWFDIGSVESYEEAKKIYEEKN